MIKQIHKQKLKWHENDVTSKWEVYENHHVLMCINSQRDWAKMTQTLITYSHYYTYMYIL